MNMAGEIAGIYLNRLIELHDLKVKAVTKQAGVSENYISRLASGKMKQPSADNLRALTEAVGGSWEDVGVLLDKRSTKAQAEALADAWFARFKNMSAIERDALRRRIREVLEPLMVDEKKMDDFVRQ